MTQSGGSLVLVRSKIMKNGINYGGVLGNSTRNYLNDIPKCILHSKRFCFLSLIFVFTTIIPSAPSLIFGFEYSSSGPPTIFVGDNAHNTPSPSFKGQKQFLERLQQSGKEKRGLYEEFFPHLGAEGILNGIEQLWPHCHSEAHDLGKVIYAHLQDIAEAIRLCDERCHSGCMHGVLMEAITTNGWTESSGFDLDVLRPLVSTPCSPNSYLTKNYSPGDCAHGVGHALTFVVQNRIREALQGCGLFEDKKQEYYCATGVFMEYVNERDKSDAQSHSLLYPCDSFAFPAACARYKMVHVVRRHYQAGQTIEELKEQCRQFPSPVRLGCFHGLGNAHVPYLAKGLVSLSQVCSGLTQEEHIVCIDGAIERLAKYHEDRALEVCQEFRERRTTHCLTAVRQKMYNMEKDLTLYLK